MNKTFVILPDVTCDLSEEIRKEFDIEFIKGHYKTPDGQDRVADLTWGDTTSEEFYKQLKLAPNDFSTSPPNIQECADAFEERVKTATAYLRFRFLRVYPVLITLWSKRLNKLKKSIPTLI